MMQSARWRGMTLPILCLAIAACAKPDARASDPNQPAVVKVPPVVLTSDTAKKVVEPVVSIDQARMMLGRLYSLAGAAFAFMDPNLITSAYAPTAQLTTPNGTFTGIQAILKEFGSFGMDGSVKEFQRQSVKLEVVDSTVVDSGNYFVTRQRNSGAAITREQGAYASVWRIHPAPMEWVMTKDHLYPASKKKAK